MTLKIVLIALLGLFFVLNGINHFVNAMTLEEYASKRGLISPVILFKLAVVL
jgi:uncharacterized membrane protein HdeD (DUF308 family)